jgi:hypothetical protein
MVRETACGLSFKLTKGGIDDGIEDVCQTKSFDNKYVDEHEIFQMGNYNL